MTVVIIYSKFNLDKFQNFTLHWSPCCLDTGAHFTLGAADANLQYSWGIAFMRCCVWQVTTSAGWWGRSWNTAFAVFCAWFLQGWSEQTKDIFPEIYSGIPLEHDSRPADFWNEIFQQRLLWTNTHARTVLTHGATSATFGLFATQNTIPEMLVSFAIDTTSPESWYGGF